MRMRQWCTHPRAARYAAVLLGVALLAALLGTGTVRQPSQGLIVADRGRTAGVFAPVRAPIAGTVVSVRAVDRQYVTAGTVLIALSTAHERSALARAAAQSRAARARVRDSLTALAAQERAASSQVRAALTTLRAAPLRVTPLHTPHAAASAPPAFVEAERQAAAAETRVRRIADAQVAAAQQTLDRDSALLAEGLISPREMAADSQALDAARAQAAGAAAAVRDAQTAAAAPSSTMTPVAPDGRAATRASAALAAAQTALDTAETAQAAAAQRLARDRTLLADGAIPAHQVDTDTAASDAASARVDAATAAVRVAQAQLAAAHATPRSTQPVVHAAAASEDRLTRQAEATIADAQLRAQALAAAQLAAVDADRALEAAKVALGETVIRAPVDGWVTGSTAAAGEAVHRGQTLMALSIQGRTWVAADVPPAAAPKIRVGSAALVTVDGYAGHVWLGRVLRVGAGPGRTDRTVEVQIGLDQNAGRGQLPGGLPAAVAIETRGTPSSAMSSGPDAGPTPSRSPLIEAAAPVRIESDDPQRARIVEQEREVLAQLNAESEEIRAIAVGAAPGPHGGAIPSFPNDGLAWPVEGTVSSGYGWRVHPIFHTPEFHTGIDIAASWGAPVEAADDGTVIFTGEMPANGKLIVLNHGNGVSTTYSHLSSYDVRVGDRVRRGQVIGRVGSTGWSTGPHLFFELRQDGQPLDPLEP